MWWEDVLQEKYLNTSSILISLFPEEALEQYVGPVLRRRHRLRDKFGDTNRRSSDTMMMSATGRLLLASLVQ
jgi:hypothetical protein